MILDVCICKLYRVWDVVEKILNKLGVKMDETGAPPLPATWGDDPHRIPPTASRFLRHAFVLHCRIDIGARRSKRPPSHVITPDFVESLANIE